MQLFSVLYLAPPPELPVREQLFSVLEDAPALRLPLSVQLFSVQPHAAPLELPVRVELFGVAARRCAWGVGVSGTLVRPAAMGPAAVGSGVAGQCAFIQRASIGPAAAVRRGVARHQAVGNHRSLRFTEHATA